MISWVNYGGFFSFFLGKNYLTFFSYLPAEWLNENRCLKYLAYYSYTLSKNIYDTIPQKRIFYIERRTRYIFCIDSCLITLLKKKPIVSTTKKQIQFKLLSVILPRRRLKLRTKKLHDKLLRNPNPVSYDRNKLAKNPKRKKKRENKKL